MSKPLNDVIMGALTDLKGKDIVTLDVSELTDVMDTLVIVSGTSNRHVKSLVDNVVEDAKAAGYRPLGVEGKEGGEWVLVDLGDTVVHAMIPSAREFYDLEKLWSLEPSGRKASGQDMGQDMSDDQYLSE
ncbi:MAG: ribosome silencing factor [Cellvibrionaceae bacterium]